MFYRGVRLYELFKEMNGLSHIGDTEQTGDACFCLNSKDSLG